MNSTLGFKKRILRSQAQAAPSEIKTTSNFTFPSGSNDVVLTILCLCDIFTVLSISQVCFNICLRSNIGINLTLGF